jgi:hypothetical protein
MRSRCPRGRTHSHSRRTTSVVGCTRAGRGRFANVLEISRRGVVFTGWKAFGAIKPSIAGAKLARVGMRRGTSGCAWVASRCSTLPHFATATSQMIRNIRYFDCLMRLLICGFSVRFRGGSPHLRNFIRTTRTSGVALASPHVRKRSTDPVLSLFCPMQRTCRGRPVGRHRATTRGSGIASLTMLQPHTCQDTESFTGEMTRSRCLGDADGAADADR